MKIDPLEQIGYLKGKLAGTEAALEKSRELSEAARVALRACREINPENPIAAAEAMPELFAACQRALWWIPYWLQALQANPERSETVKALQAAIRKATEE